MERVLESWQNGYRATPTEYPISNNNRPATYDQFMTLRDTMVFTNKYYADKAGRSLIIGTKLDGTPTDTIEIWEPNIVRLDFQPWWLIVPYTTWEYVSTWGHGWISCEIKKKWRYRIQHKEQFDDVSSITRVNCYVIQHTGNSTMKRAEFDWEWSSAWMIKRLTSFGYVECDLDKWDWLELVMVDQNWNNIQSLVEYDSNWWMVEYIDLAYNI